MPKRTTYPHQRERYYDKYTDILKIILQKEIKEQRLGKKTWSVDENDIQYEYANDIADIYNTIETIEAKEAFLDVMQKLNTVKDTLEDNDFFGIISLSFFGLCKIGFFDEALNLIIRTESPFTIIQPIKAIINNKINYFNTEELGIILDVFKKILFKFDRYYPDLYIELQTLIDDIVDLRYLDLKKKLNHFNQEINTDKRQVIEYLKKFGFEDKYDKTLNVLDKFLSNDGIDESMIPGGAIGTLREFFKDFYIDLAKKISHLNQLEDTPRNETSTEEIGHAVIYIGKEFNLSSDEKKLLGTYKDITNNIGSHSMLSEKKYLRLTRNIGIEICLFMLTKFEDYKKHKE